MKRLALGHFITDKVYALGILDGKQLVCFPMDYLDGAEANAMLICGLTVLLYYVMTDDLSDETEVTCSTTKLINCMKLGECYTDGTVHMLREFIRLQYATKYKRKRKRLIFKHVNRDKNEAYKGYREG